jgi:GNAT superfamily N-acetyltransferase
MAASTIIPNPADTTTARPGNTVFANPNHLRPTSDDAPTTPDQRIAQSEPIPANINSNVGPHSSIPADSSEESERLQERGQPRDMGQWGNQHGETDRIMQNPEVQKDKHFENKLMHPVSNPVTVQFPATKTHPQGPRVSFADEATAQKHSPSVWEQLKGEVGALAQGLGGPATTDEAEQGLKNTPTGFTHPWESLKAAVSGVAGSANNASLMDKAKASWQAGDKVTALRHGVNALIPFVGKNADIAGDELASGDYAKAVGHTLSAILPFLLGGTEAPAAATTEAAAVPKGELWEDVQGSSPASVTSTAKPLAATRQVAEPWEDVQAEPRPQTQNVGLDDARAARDAANAPRATKGASPQSSAASRDLSAEAGQYLAQQSKGKSLADMHTESAEHAPDATSQAEIDEAANKEIAKIQKSPSGKPNVSFETHEGTFINRHRASINIGKAGEVGHVEAVSEPANPDAWRINSVDLDPEFRNKGLGVQAYEKLAKEADKAGVSRLESGGNVSPDAQNVWNALKRRGHDVTQTGTKENPQFVLQTGTKVKPTASIGQEWENFAHEQLSK